MKKLYPALDRLSNIDCTSIFSDNVLKESKSFSLLYFLQLVQSIQFILSNKYFLQFTTSSKAMPNNPPLQMLVCAGIITLEIQL